MSCFLPFDAYLEIRLLPLVADPLCDIRVLLHCNLALARDETGRQPVANIRVTVDRLMPDWATLQFCWKETVRGAIVYMSQGFVPVSSFYKRETRDKQEKKESMCGSFVWCCRIETSTLSSRTLWTFHEVPLTFLTTAIVLDGFPFHWIYAFFLVHVLRFTCRGQGWVSLRWLTTKSQLRTNQ